MAGTTTRPASRPGPRPDTPFGSILDVPGIGVGHHQRVGRGWQTGTTVVTCAGGAVPGVDVRGGGPGTRETDALRPENLVREIHAICLTGGSAYGLAAADGVVSVLAARGLGFRVGDDPLSIVPVVPAAVIFDLGRAGVFTNRPDASFGQRAVRRAMSGRSTQAWGSVGAGTGARAGGLQGGVGTASRTIRIPIDNHDDADVRSGADGSDRVDSSSHSSIEVTVGALAVVNANGSPIDVATGLPFEPSGARLRPPSAAQRNAVRAALTGSAAPDLNTTIGVVATSARLDKAEASKMACVAHDGLARAIRPAHSMTDGDTIFALAVGTDPLPHHRDDVTRFSPGPTRLAALNLILRAAADTFAAACTHAVLAATTIGDSPAWSDLCPDAAIDT